MQRRLAPVLFVAFLIVVGSGCDAVRTRVLLKEAHDLYRAQKYEEAIAAYRKVVEIVPDHWEANYRIAVSYLALYHPGSTHPKDMEYADRAAEALRRCLELDPPEEERAKVNNYYVGLLTSADRTGEAVAHYETLLAQAPTDKDLMIRLAGLYAKAGNFPKALELYHARAKLEPDNKEAWYAIGVVCWDRSYNGGIMVSAEERERVVEEGLRAVERALEIDPQYFEGLSYANLLYREKAKLLGAAGKNAEAGEAYMTADRLMKKALEVRPTGPDSQDG
jgi:tetratricopeptide (TPR) repeat protein